MQKTIELSLDSVRELLPCVEGKLNDLIARRTELDAQISSTQSTVDEMKAHLSSSDLPPSNGQSSRQRLPKGFAESAIEKVLKTLKVGESMPLGELVKKSGIGYSTVFKIVTNPKRNKGRFIESDGSWKLK